MFCCVNRNEAKMIFNLLINLLIGKILFDIVVVVKCQESIHSALHPNVEERLIDNTNYEGYSPNANGNSNDYNASNRFDAPPAFNLCPQQCACLDDYFECKKLNLKHVPPLPRWVKNLELTGNRLDENVENTIGNLTELVRLNLKKNRLHKIPVFKGLDALEKLNLAHNKIQAITIESMLSLPNLKELDLSKNIIKTILPNSFPVRNSITLLNLNFNRLNSLEENSFDHLKTLNDLQIAHNSLTNLPHGLFKFLKILKKLDLSNNRINITFSTFKGLDELRVLKLRSNCIKFLPDGVFYPLKSILLLELDSNEITSINRGGFFNLTSLTSLSLSNNSINRIEMDIWEYTQLLITLDLSNNNLTQFGQSNLECLRKLRKLNLSNNNIKHLQDTTFSCANNLEQIDLSGNQLFWTIEEDSTIVNPSTNNHSTSYNSNNTTATIVGMSPFSVLKRLQKLDLSSNGIREINHKSFTGLINLQILNLNENNLTTIHYNAFESLEHLQKLYINSQMFLCDCDLQWLYHWLKEMTKLTGSINIVCDYPVNLRGVQLVDLKEGDFMCNESPKPKLIKEPSNYLAIKGTNLTLECKAKSSLPSEMTIQWRRDNLPIRYNDQKAQMKVTSTSIEDTDNSLSGSGGGNHTITSSYLHMFNVSNSHNGRYQCVVSNIFGTTYSQRFKITVATYPRFITTPSNITLNVGGTARLECTAYGEPMPQIEWQKDGGNDFPAARERRMHVMTKDDPFFIINAKASDMGVYTCTAENPAGIIKANATLTVFEPPTFVKPMENKEVTAGKSSVLECMISGSPKPVLRWLKDDRPIHLTERHFYAAEGQLLIIVDTIPSDAGTYRCDIENDLGVKSGYLTLKVNNKPSVSSNGNVVNVEEMTGIVIITVFCCAVGTSVIWVVIIYQTKKGTELGNNSGNGNSAPPTIPNSMNGGSAGGGIVSGSNCGPGINYQNNNNNSNSTLFLNHLPMQQLDRNTHLTSLQNPLQNSHRSYSPTHHHNPLSSAYSSNNSCDGLPHHSNHPHHHHQQHHNNSHQHNNNAQTGQYAETVFNNTAMLNNTIIINDDGNNIDTISSSKDSGNGDSAKRSNSSSDLAVNYIPSSSNRDNISGICNLSNENISNSGVSPPLQQFQNIQNGVVVVAMPGHHVAGINRQNNNHQRCNGSMDSGSKTGSYNSSIDDDPLKEQSIPLITDETKTNSNNSSSHSCNINSISKETNSKQTSPPPLADSSSNFNTIV